MTTKTTTTKAKGSTRSRKSTAKKDVDIKEQSVANADVETAEVVAQMKEATETMKKMADATVKAVEKTKKSTKRVANGAYNEEDMIPCKSTTPGELILIGRKSGTKYVWSGYGDICEVEVRDLNSLRAVKSDYLFKPYFMIEDNEFVGQPKWEDVKSLYNKIIEDDIAKIMAMSNEDFKSTLVNLPKGLQEAVRAAISTEIINDTFDSLQKVKIADEVLGSDLKSLLK